ncbi:MAG: alpha-amylase family glycosyl hydrolase [Herpetosiphon sp.]
MQGELKWWQRGVVYQVYPRSFQDSDGDGVGDLPGILQRLDYLQRLGVDAVWLSPIYPSPMADFGYDVADYCDIHPLFGTLDDFDRLVKEVHDRGMKLILDLVPNHTSDEHPWFRESRASRDNPKRDWYIWRDARADGSLPNNWLSFFGGPAWTFDADTQQYYLHQFATKQPELNYRNPQVLEAMLDVIRFWLRRGVDGFRMDVIWMLMKDEALRDEPPNPAFNGSQVGMQSLQHIYTQDLPETHSIIRRFRDVIDSYDDRVMIGEIYLDHETLMAYYGTANDECHLPFNFQLILLPEWKAGLVQQLVGRYESLLPHDGWPNWVLGNHDQHRLATRVGAAQARIANMMLMTLRGTPTTYYGEELGMTNGKIPLEKIQDPPALLQPEFAGTQGRDPERTPMQWNGTPGAGFTRDDVEPWLPIAESVGVVNVEAEEVDNRSMLQLYRALTAIRRREPALYGGSYAAVEADRDDVFAYMRTGANNSFLVVLNFGSESQVLDLHAVGEAGEIAVASDMQRRGRVDLQSLTLHGNEGLVIRLTEGR